MPGWIWFGDKYPTTWSGKPPQMLDRDVPVWQEFREKNYDKYDYFYYNVAMTLIELPTENMTPNMIRQAYYAVSKRVDVLAVKGRMKFLIEVTTRAAVRSVGQVITYLFLYKTITGERDNVKGMIVCNYTDKDILEVCKYHGIEVVQLHPIT